MLGQQEEMALLEEVSDACPIREERRAWGMPAGTLWLSERGLALSRFVPLSQD